MVSHLSSSTPEHERSGGAGITLSLAERVLDGDRIAAGRLITLLENGTPGIEKMLRLIVPHTGRAHVVGVTGPAGSGKSTLVGRLAREFRSRGRKVGVIAVDPTSPFTGGAVLGDRVRMPDLSLDRGIFIRSMASRGALGGLAHATAGAVKVLDGYGCDLVLVETVGAGQDEIDVARLAQTTVVVQVPGMGDEVQAIKAGLLEIGDIFAVNKADRVRSDIAVSDLRMMIETSTRHAPWIPPIIKTVATRNEGIVGLADAVELHLEHLKKSGELADRQKETARRELLEALRRGFLDELLASDGPAVEAMIDSVADRRLDARSAAMELLRDFRESPGNGDDSEGAE